MSLLHGDPAADGCRQDLSEDEKPRPKRAKKGKGVR